MKERVGGRGWAYKNHAVTNTFIASDGSSVHDSLCFSDFLGNAEMQKPFTVRRSHGKKSSLFICSVKSSCQTRLHSRMYEKPSLAGLALLSKARQLFDW